MLLLGAVGGVSAEEVVLLSESTTLDSWGATSVMTATSSQVSVGDFIKIVVDEIPSGAQLSFKNASWGDICVGNGQLASETYYKVTSDIYTELTGSGIMFQGNGGVIISKISIVPATDFEVITIYNGGGTIDSAWGNVPIPGGNFNAVEEGDILVVNTTSETTGNENFLFKKNGYDDALSTYSLTKPWCVSLTSEVISGYYNNSNHIQSGTAGITVNSVEVYRLKEKLPKGEKTLTPDDALPTAFGSWANSVKISSDQFADVVVGDEIRIALSDADVSNSYNAQLWIKTQSEGYPLLKPITESADEGYNVPYIPEVVFTVSSEDVATQLRATGLVLQGQNVTVTSVKLYQSTVSVTPGKEYVSFSSEFALDFSEVSGLEAYIASEASSSSVTLTQVNEAQAGTGLILKGTAGTTYEIPVIASSEQDKGILTAALTATDPSGDVYVLSDGEFHPLNSDITIPAGKAYLDASYVGSGSRNLAIVFGGEDDGTTAIKNIKVGTEDNVYYNLQGQRVLYPTKGLYIVNGKKVIVK